jgi:hypothetical protein
MILILMLFLISTLSSIEGEKCKMMVNCRLPSCLCSSTTFSDNFNISDIPMMIALTFSGALSSDHSKYIKQILNPEKRNPNGCATQATFFISDKNEDIYSETDYCLVRQLFDNNNEIGVSLKTYSCPYTDCRGKFNNLFDLIETE